MLTCGANRKRSTPSNLMPSTSAAAVRSSIVSRSMAGSDPSPLPTTPGHAALCSFGNVLGWLAALMVMPFWAGWCGERVRIMGSARARGNQEPPDQFLDPADVGDPVEAGRGPYTSPGSRDVPEPSGNWVRSICSGRIEPRGKMWTVIASGDLGAPDDRPAVGQRVDPRASGAGRSARSRPGR